MVELNQAKIQFNQMEQSVQLWKVCFALEINE